MPEKKDRSNGDGQPRIGVYICHCGVNIADIVSVGEAREYIGKQPNVVIARDYKFMCSDPGQDLIKDDIQKLNVNRVVVAACSPRWMEVDDEAVEPRNNHAGRVQ